MGTHWPDRPPVDHIRTLLTIHPHFQENGTNKAPKTHQKGAVDWIKFRTSLKECLLPYPHLLNKEEFTRAALIFSTNLDIVLAPAKGPTSNQSNPLPFWDVELTLLHKDKEPLARNYHCLPHSHPQKKPAMEEL